MLHVIYFMCRATRYLTHLFIAQFGECVDYDAEYEVEADGRDDDEERNLVDGQQHEVGERISATLLMTN